MGAGVDLINGVYVEAEPNSSNEVTGSSKNEKFNLGGGDDDVINFDIDGGKKIGNNTVYLSQNENLTVKLFGDTSENSFTSKISGNDVIVTVYKNKTSLGTINFKNAGLENPAQNVKIQGTNWLLPAVDILAQNYTIDKSKSKKGVKIKGTALNEIITGSKKADTIYTGSGNDTIYTGKGKDTIVINGKGNKDIYIHQNEGDKTIKFQNVKNTDNITLHLDDTHYRNPISGIKKGNDLYLKTLYYDYSLDKSTARTYSLLNYFNNSLTPADFSNLFFKDGDDSAKALSDYFKSYSINVYGDKKRNVVGTDYNEYLYGTNKNDIISTGDGYDRVYAGKGNDEIKINGTGNKRIYISDNDGDKVVNVSSGFSDRINLYINSTDILSAEIADNDLILYRTFDSGKTTKTEKIEYRNLLLTDNKLDMVYINDRSFTDLYSDTIFAYIKTAGRKGKFDVTYNDNNKIIKGSSKKDTITITKSTSPRVFAGAGNDTINITDSAAFITGGLGKDTINIIDNSAVVINHKAGDGNDIINIQSDNTSVKLNLSVQNKYFNDAHYYGNYFIGARMGFRQSGNDLIMQIPSAKSKVETITFKDFYLNSGNWANTHVNAFDVNGKKTGSIETGLISGLTKEWGFWATGIYDKTTKTTSYLAADDNYNNCYEYNGKGKAIMYGSSKKDNYLVKLTNKSNLYINDLCGTNKLYIQNNLKSLRFFFNVGLNSDSSGIVSVTSDSLSDNLLIFDSKKSMTVKNLKNILNEKEGKGVININSYFAEFSGDYVADLGSGYTDVYVSKNIMQECINNKQYDSYWADYETFSEISEKVASWLSNHTQYADSFDVIRNGSNKEISELLKIYTSKVSTVDVGI